MEVRRIRIPSVCFNTFARVSLRSSSEIRFSRSDLFNRMIAFFPSNKEIIFRSSSSRFPEASTTYRIISAFTAYFLARSTPIFSTISCVSWIPAVSIIFRLIPCRLIVSCRASLVVPAISVTMALSSPNSIFRREDLPAFGFPTMTVEIPSFISLPLSAVSNNFSICFSNFFTFTDNCSGYPSRLICSGSSNADSIKAI